MAIRWFNIRSGEEQVAETEPHISAMWASSDHSPNITQGQDFGWRMAPEVVIQMKEIKQDPVVLQQIATRINKSIEDVNEPDILTYISAKVDAANAPVAGEDDYTDMYDQEVRRLTQAQLEAKQAALPQVTTTETTESLADLQRRVELEERLSAAKAVNEATTTTTTSQPNTATTTTAVPTTTSTTTKK